MGGHHSKHEKVNVYSGNYESYKSSTKASNANPVGRDHTKAVAYEDAEDVLANYLQPTRTAPDQPFTPEFPNDFYDGIPRYQSQSLSLKSRSFRSSQAAVAKVSEVSSRLGRASTHGLGKVLDTLGSSMINLNSNAGFASAGTSKSNELGIVSFEVANTIVKGANLMQSVSRRSMRVLKEVVLPSEGVQNLVSQDMDELLRIVSRDKREELKIFSGEVVRFGNGCKDPQWHNLDRYFEKISRELTPKQQLKDVAESVTEILMTLVHYTAELYNELLVLDRMEQVCHNKRQDEVNKYSQKGDNVAMLRAELKSQRKLVRNLKRKSLWSRSMEEVMDKLVDIVHFLLIEIHNAFGADDVHVETKGSVSDLPRLGPSGLSLHYANIIMQIDTIVARSSSMPPNARDALYQSLPPGIKSALRIKLQSFHVKEELTITEIKDEMEKTLQWLVPMSTNTAKAHHGFGWVGEWANTGSDNRKPAAGPIDIIRIETLHYASKERTEAYVLDLLLWLHHLVSKSKTVVDKGVKKAPTKSSIPTSQEPSQLLEAPDAVSASIKEKKMLQDLDERKGMPEISNSKDFDLGNTGLTKNDRLNDSSGSSPTRISEGVHAATKLPSMVPDIAFGIENVKTLGAIKAVDIMQ